MKRHYKKAKILGPIVMAPDQRQFMESDLNLPVMDFFLFFFFIQSRIVNHYISIDFY